LFQFSNSASGQTEADLAISIYNSPLDVYPNDYMPYAMFVTNLGPGTVSSVVVTNILPAGFSLVNASPAYTLSGNILTFSLGSLTNLAVQKLVVIAKPSSAGNYTFTTSVSASGNSDPNSANNSASFNVNVGNYLSTSITTSLVSTQQVDAQDGNIAQLIQILNNGSSSIPSARVVVTGLTNQLYEPAGTNNGNPFVIYGSTLAPGQTATLLLEFTPRNSFSFNNSQLQAYATPMASLAPPANLGMAISTYTAGQLTSASGPLPTGTIVNFWWSVTNRSYTVLYSDNPQFANPLMSPGIVPPTTANEAEWIDYGPPMTVSPPTNTIPRYYRVYLNP
jgi:uncharacterized repeat protein (TIGR01451 family)